MTFFRSNNCNSVFSRTAISVVALILGFNSQLALANSTVEVVATAKTDVLESYRTRPIQDEVFYFVLPDRFNNGDKSNDNGAASGVSSGGLDTRSKWAFHGGDLIGLNQKLDYLQNMGISAIWMTPLLRNQAIQETSFAHHGYWIVDFTEIDPHFGSNNDLKQLIDAAHKRNMKVFFDIITNHTADIIKYRECHQENGKFIADTTCQYRDLATSKNTPYSPFVPAHLQNLKKPAWLNDPKYYHNQGDSTFKGESSLNGDFNGLDDLDTRQPAVLNGMIDIYKALIKEFKPDGFRIDTVKHVNLDFWQTFSPSIIDYAKQQGIPNFYMFGEVYDPDPKVLSQFTTEGKLPSVLDFAFQDIAAKVFFQDAPTSLIKTLFEQDKLYKDEDSDASGLLTFLGNHDMGRAGYFIQQAQPTSSAEDHLSRSMLSHAFMMLSRGVPVIYYGDEQGFTGDGNDVDAREDMFASNVASYNDNILLGTQYKTIPTDYFNQQHPLYLHIQALSQLRSSQPSLRYGQIVNTYLSENQQAFAVHRQSSQGKDVVVVFNPSQKLQTISIPAESIPLNKTALLHAHTELKQKSSTHSTSAISKLAKNKIIIAPLSYAVFELTP